jgi:hypothetical protein
MAFWTVKKISVKERKLINFIISISLFLNNLIVTSFCKGAVSEKGNASFLTNKIVT